MTQSSSSSYFNEEGEPLMTAAQARFEAVLDEQPDIDDYYNRWHNETDIEVDPAQCNHGDRSWLERDVTCDICGLRGVAVVKTDPFERPQDNDDPEFILWGATV